MMEPSSASNRPMAPSSTGQKIWDALCDPMGHQHRLAAVAEKTGLGAGTVRDYVRNWALAGDLIFDSGVARIPKSSRLDAPGIDFDAFGKLVYVARPDDEEYTLIDRTRDSRNPTVTRHRWDEGPIGRGEDPAPIEGEVLHGDGSGEQLPAVHEGTNLPAVHEDADLPALLDTAYQALALATDNAARLGVRDYARAVEAVASIGKLTEAQVNASILVQTAERSVAISNPAPDPKTTGRGHKLAPADIDPSVLRKIRSAHAHVDDDAFRGLIADARASGEPLTRKMVAAAGREARGASSPKVVHYSGDYERVSPPHIVEAARRVMGGIDLDPASREEANQVVKAERYYTEHEDGLKRAWRGRVWLNPPYKGSLVQAFVFRLIEHVEAGKVSEAILLTNNSTDTIWWQAAAAHALACCLPAGRLGFLTAGLKPVGGSPIQGQAILYFGSVTNGGFERFNAEFRRHGVVFYPAPQEEDE